MKNILTIFKKELMDMLRDRRTVLTMIVMPILLLPVILSLTTSISSSQMKKTQDKNMRVAIHDNGNGEDLVKRITRRKDLKIIEQVASKDFNQLIRDDSLDMAIVIDNGFDLAISNGETGKIEVLYNSTKNQILFQRIETTFKRYNDAILTQRLDSLGAEKSLITPIEVTEDNVFTQSESLGKMAGGFLPYMFVIFCLMGAMYPAIDMFTGEKERGTIETILSVPASRLEILMGKMAVVIIAGVTSGVLTIIGLYAALKLNSDIPSMIKDIVTQILNVGAMTWIILMLIPLTTFFAGILIPMSIYAKSFKEAQSLITPLTFVVIFPLIVAMMPGIELNIMTALIPIVNVALASKEIIAGTIDYTLLALVFVSLFIFAGFGVALCVKWFGSEGNILRT